MTQDTSIKHIELNVFLKKCGLPGTGGKIKMFIRQGSIKVNGEIETKNKRKLHEKDIVEYLDGKFIVTEDLLR